MSIQHTHFHVYHSDVRSRYGFVFGLETELVLPYYGNRWSIIIEPGIQFYSTVQSEEVDYLRRRRANVIEVNYSSIEVPVGVRRNFHIGNASKIFITPSVVFDFSFNSNAALIVLDGKIHLDAEPLPMGRNVAMSAGYKYKDRYSMEVRYHTNRNMLKSHTGWNSHYKGFTFQIGYSLF